MSDMMYDVGQYIASRKKAVLPFSDFIKLVAADIFLLEYIVDDGEHVISWCRALPEIRIENDSFVVYDARILDDEVSSEGEKPSEQTAEIVIQFDRLLAMRFKANRYNWNKSEKVFIQE